MVECIIREHVWKDPTLPLSIRKQLPVIAVIFILGTLICCYFLAQVHDGAASMTFDQFSLYIIVIPCAAMLVCSFVSVLIADEISRQQYLLIVVICMVLGVISMVVTSNWMSDPTIADALLANSPGRSEIVPVLRAPLIMLRDVAAYFVMGTVGCIAGAWVGSRLHPMRLKGGKKRNKKKRR